MANRKTSRPKRTYNKTSSSRSKSSKSTRSKKSTPARRTSSKAKSTAKPSSRKPVSNPLQGGLSLDRKLDIVGVVLALVGLLTLLSLVSSSRGAITTYWVNTLSKLFGWGVYVFPLGLMGLGAWLILRNFDKIPKLALERLLGLILLFINFLVILHTLLRTDTSDAARFAAENGQGGGFIGYGLMVFLGNGLGLLGLVIVLLAWGLIALALTLDRSVLDLFRWVPPAWLRLQDTWDELQAQRRERAAQRNANQRPQRSVQISPQVPARPAAATTSAPANPAAAQPSPENLAQTAPMAVPYPDVEPRPFVLPQIAEMLDEGTEFEVDDEFDRQRARVIEETLSSFSAPAHVVEINRGPVITQFGVEPDFIENNRGRTRVRVGKIASLADDLALVLAASRVRVEAPVPGKGFVGIEVPNEKVSVVALRDVIESPAFQRLNSPLRFALGQDVAGNAVAGDLIGMPHMLIAGATGSGKSVCVNAIIACYLLNNTPETLRFIMVDPKRVELTGYNGIPHLLAPVVVDIDKIVGVLQWVTREMDSRYQKFADVGARNIANYNRMIAAKGEKKLPYLVVVIDELADLMMVAPDQTEKLITRMAQLARATGIHLIISTQRPSVDVVTGLIKANIPSRISFATASGTDSRVILDAPGAERLLGRGDMLFQAPDSPAPVRLQGVWVSEPEIMRIVQYWRGFSSTAATTQMTVGGAPDALPAGIPLKQMEIWEEMQEEEPTDDLFGEAVAIVREEGRASISMLQRRLRVGYTRAARLIDEMENREIISPPYGGAHTREVLDYGEFGAPPADD